MPTEPHLRDFLSSYVITFYIGAVFSCINTNEPHGEFLIIQSYFFTAYCFSMLFWRMRILIVAPYIELVETCKNTLSDLPYEIQIAHGDLHTGLQVALREIENNSIDIVISRGGTANLLKSNLSVPVFEIEVSGYDLLRTIYPHILTENKIAVIGYPNIISGAKSISSILGISPIFYQIDSQTDIKEKIVTAGLEGAKIIVGDTISVNTAHENGIEGYIVKSGPESIISAVESAVSFYKHMQREILTNKRLGSIIEHTTQGVIYLSADNRIEMLNSKAEEILNVNRRQIIGEYISVGLIPEAFSKSFLNKAGNQLINLNGTDYFLEILPIYTAEVHAATLVFIQSSAHIKNIEGIIRQQLIRKGLVADYNFNSIIAKSQSYTNSIEKAICYSRTDSTILLLGETGSGKEVFAQSIHNASLRKNGPFVAVNCAALPDSLLESELFGYVEGAFTGAKKGGKAGFFEMAHKGTIFLDEINDMSSTVQARLLRVLQEKQVMRIGDNMVFDVDIRIIAACNKDLFAETENGNFRKDLYYRLNILDIEIAPLRNRREDILPLFNFYIKQFSRKYSMDEFQPTPELLQGIREFSWPGNIRQLRNFAEKVSVLASLKQNKDIILGELLDELNNPKELAGKKFRTLELSEADKRSKTLKELEQEIIIRTWEQNDHNISRTAKELDIDRVTLRKKLGAELNQFTGSAGKD